MRLEGSVVEEEIERFVENWRECAATELREYLAMNGERYQLWATTPSALPFMLTARKCGVTPDHEWRRTSTQHFERYKPAVEHPLFEQYVIN